MSSPSLVIRNGTIVDGSGGEAYEADLSVIDGKIAAIPGLRTPGRNILAFIRAEATIAPVCPAETTALTSPAAIIPQHFEIELSRFFRSASTGFSSMPMIWLA